MRRRAETPSISPMARRMSIYDAAMKYKGEGAPLVVFAGAEYGNGSSRDWAAKGTTLLGVRAVIAQSFERIHRSNLVGMGVLPLTFETGTTGSRSGSPAPRGDDRRPGREPDAAPDAYGEDRLCRWQLRTCRCSRASIRWTSWSISERRDFALRAAGTSRRGLTLGQCAAWPLAPWPPLLRIGADLRRRLGIPPLIDPADLPQVKSCAPDGRWISRLKLLLLERFQALVPLWSLRRDGSGGYSGSTNEPRAEYLYR